MIVSAMSAQVAQRKRDEIGGKAVLIWDKERMHVVAISPDLYVVNDVDYIALQVEDVETGHNRRIQLFRPTAILTLIIIQEDDL